MNLTEKIALDCGLKIDKPFVDKLFLPLQNHNFILFDTRFRHPSGEYDHYNEVIALIKDRLSKNDISIIQLADDKQAKLNCDRCYIGINKKQEAYLINKSKILIANENSSIYLANALNVKSVGLYSVFSPKITQPIWNKDIQIVFESHRDKNLPSYGLTIESPKTINFIDPYKVAASILDSLNIEHNLNKYELLHLGNHFNEKIIEVVPDFITDENFLANSSINLRLDYIDKLDLNTLIFWTKNRKCNLLTDKDLNLQVIAPLFKNIINFTIILSDKITENFLKQCKSIFPNLKLYCNDKNKLIEYRFKFLDFNIEKDFNENNYVQKIENISPSSFFESSKHIYSKGQKYSCFANFLLKKPLDNSPETVIFSQEFNQDLDYYKIYNEKNN